jgi:general secretion pathway protein A
MYLEFYQLREEPFNLTPDPRFLHMAPPYRVALEAVVQSIVRRKGFVVVSGPIGTGKTTVLHAAMQILSRLDTNLVRLASAFVLNPMLSRDEFLETLMIEFQVSCTSTSKPARLAALQELFLEKQKKGGTSVLIVDEAHLLTLELLEEIRLLSNTDVYREKLLQIVLCGQPELIPLLQRRELRALQQRITQHCSLRPLSLAETHSYVAERLHSAGLTGESPFCSGAVELVHLHSQGVPRLINQICDGALMIGFTTQRKEIRQDIIEEAAGQFQLTSGPVEEPQELVNVDEVELAAGKVIIDLLTEALNQRRAAEVE